MGYSGAGGKLIHEKNQKQKISWHCPFKAFIQVFSIYVQTIFLNIWVSASSQLVYAVFTTFFIASKRI